MSRAWIGSGDYFVTQRPVYANEGETKLQTRCHYETDAGIDKNFKIKHELFKLIETLSIISILGIE